ncbi:adenylyltransferase/cytidyltransferase family protein [Pseudonocardia sp. H11422]|uniref:adenylyltransferase/cytidyltransferase family protein n=1 Tax=Pseudonocardia sp. H11422 TaxID=2835866 RepID=UPI001BDD7910|nr:adenylyltransferase/cytidyltransferase family protein [Pseudonocardia sp. H11422]
MTAPALLGRAPLWQGLEEIPAGRGPCVVTVGVFDGLHRGHARVIEQAVRLGRARGLPTVLVTFDPHPAQVLGLSRDTAVLSTVDRRAELAGELGVDALCVLPFTPELARVDAAEFVERVLVDALRAHAVVVGSNFTFGHRGAGDVHMLHRLGGQYGFATHGVDLVYEADGPCSSSYVRECIGRGDLRAAARALGRPHRVDGIAVPSGPGRAARVVEITVPEHTALPAPGRYTARLVSAMGEAVSVEVGTTADGRVLVRLPGRAVSAGPVAVEFLA